MSVYDDRTAGSPARYAAPAELGRLGRLGWVVGGIAAVAVALGGFLGGGGVALYRAWLVAWLFWLGLSLGCLALLMIQHLTAGAWGLLARRVWEAGARALPLLLLLGVPLFWLGLEPLYVWMRPETAASDLIRELLEHKEPYLNATAFWWRFAGYFALWLGLTFWLSRLSRRQDASGDAAISRRLRAVAAPGLVLFAFAVTFGSIDWLMSLEPEWFSTIYGAIFFGGLGMATLAFTILMMLWMRGRSVLGLYLEAKHFHDYGKLMFAFVLLWTYFSFSQYLIIWSGNQAEEIGWYLHRLHSPGWSAIGVALLLLHFAVPFALLLSRDLKRHPRRLAVVAVALLAMHWVELYWQAAPSLSPDGFTLGWIDLVAPLAIGGLWLGWFCRSLASRPVLAYNDPHLRDVPIRTDGRAAEVVSHG